MADQNKIADICALLNETYGYKSTSPGAQRNINAALELLNELTQAAAPAVPAVDAGAVAAEQAKPLDVNRITSVVRNYRANHDSSQHEVIVKFGRSKSAADKFLDQLGSIVLASQLQATPLEVTSEPTAEPVAQLTISGTGLSLLTRTYTATDRALKEGCHDLYLGANRPAEGEATSEQMGGAQVAKGEWRDKLRWSKANTDYHGYIAFTPGQLEHFVSMLIGERAAEGEATSERKPLTDAESAQWRNIQHVVRELAAFCFGSSDHPQFGTAYVALVNSLTAKDGLRVQLEPLVTQAPAERKPLTRPEVTKLYIESFKAMVGRLRDTPKNVPDTVFEFAQLVEQHHGIGGGK